MERGLSDYEKTILLLLSSEAQLENLISYVSTGDAWYSFLQCFKEDNADKIKLRLSNLRQTVEYMPDAAIRKRILDSSDDIARKVYDGVEEHKAVIQQLSKQLLEYIQKKIKDIQQSSNSNLDPNIFYNQSADKQKNKLKL